MSATATKPRKMRARYSGVCAGCGGKVHPGETVFWQRTNATVSHENCCDDDGQPVEREVFGTGVGARNGYGHWNEDADWMWWQECGRFGE